MRKTFTRTIFMLILGLFLYTAARAQTQTVDQAFIDSATKAFREVRADRDLIQVQKDEISLQNSVIEARAGESAAKDALIQALNERDAARTQVINALQLQVKALSALSCDTTSLFWGIIKKKRCR